MQNHRLKLQRADSKEHNFQKISNRKNKLMTMHSSCSWHCIKPRSNLPVLAASKTEMCNCTNYLIESVLNYVMVMVIVVKNYKVILIVMVIAKY